MILPTGEAAKPIDTPDGGTASKYLGIIPLIKHPQEIDSRAAACDLQDAGAPVNLCDDPIIARVAELIGAWEREECELAGDLAARIVSYIRSEDAKDAGYYIGGDSLNCSRVDNGNLFVAELNRTTSLEIGPNPVL